MHDAPQRERVRLVAGADAVALERRRVPVDGPHHPARDRADGSVAELHTVLRDVRDGTRAPEAAVSNAHDGAVAVSREAILLIVVDLRSVDRAVSAFDESDGDAVLTLCLLVLLAGGSAAREAWTLRDPVRRALGASGSPAVSPTLEGVRFGWPVRTAMVVIALAYFFAGFQKWRYSGLPWVTSDNMRWILYASSDSHSHPNGLALFVADRPVLAHLFAAGSLLLETLFPLVLFVPRLRWLFVPGAVSMHLGIRLAMGLDYSALAATVVIVFVDWQVVVVWVRRSVATAPAPRAAPR